MLDKKYILFDLDGTLTDPYEGITKSLQYSLKHFGIDESQENLKRFIGPPLKDSFMDFYSFDVEKAQLAAEKFRERFLVTGIFENKVMDGIPALLEELQNNGKIIVTASSKPKESVEVVINHFGLEKYFAFLGGSTFSGDRYTKSDVIQYVLDEMNIEDVSQAVMIGDRKHDIIGAKDFGITSIGVLFGYGDRAEHEKAGADYIVETVADLRDLLLG